MPVPMATSHGRVHGPNQNVQQVVHADADLVPRHTHDAGIPRPEHLDLDATAQAELLEPMHVIGRPRNVGNAGRLSHGELRQREEAIRGGHGPDRQGGC